MLKFHAEKFVELTVLLRSMTTLYSIPGYKLTDVDRSGIAEQLAKGLALLEEIGLVHSAKKAIKISLQSRFAGYDGQHFSVAIAELVERIKDELEESYCLHLSVKESELYEPKEPLFGKEVDTKFPGLIDEIKEAGRCLGLGRSTAGAFHAIRCLEAGIQAICKSLVIPDPTKGADRSWPNLLRAIDSATEQRWPSKTGRMSGDAEVFDQLYGSLSGMQNPYRNATMHFDHSYTPEDAKLIFDIVCGFMKKIASRMDENGLPLA